MQQPSDLIHTITLVSGDWSHDGHNISSNNYIKSNLSHKEIEKAYKKGVKKLNIDLTEDICRDYEDNSIAFEDLKKFIDAGFLDNLKNEFKLSKNDLKAIKMVKI